MKEGVGVHFWGVFIAVNVIGIASNLDNCGIGLAYGSKRVPFRHSINACINFIGLVTAFVGAYGGKVVSHWISPQAAAWVGCVVLCSMGVFFWYTAYIHPLFVKRDQPVAGVEHPNWKHGIALGLGLSVTNVVSGFGATVANPAVMWGTVICIAVWGYILMWLGNRVGLGVLSKVLGQYASLFAGVLLMAAGVHQVI